MEEGSPFTFLCSLPTLAHPVPLQLQPSPSLFIRTHSRPKLALLHQITPARPPEQFCIYLQHCDATITLDDNSLHLHVSLQLPHNHVHNHASDTLIHGHLSSLLLYSFCHHNNSPSSYTNSLPVYNSNFHISATI